MSVALSLIQDQELSKVVLWDLGPAEPGKGDIKMPEPPVPPKGQPGEPAFDVAMVTFEPRLRAYKKAVALYAAAVEDYEDWQERWGGPYERHGLFSCEAHDDMHNGRCRKCKDCKDWEAQKGTSRVGPYAACTNSRYRISASTRGRGDLKERNNGLPEGMKPGHGHRLLMERIAAGNDDRLQMQRRDPVFGMGG